MLENTEIFDLSLLLDPSLRDNYSALSEQETLNIITDKETFKQDQVIESTYLQRS